MKKLILRHKKAVLWSVALVSVAMVFIAPLEDLIRELEQNLPWITGGVIITESLFILGLLTMAGVVGHDLGPNPFKWRAKFHDVLVHIPDHKMFWLGFWVNALGAAGSGIVVGFGIIQTLPWQSWGLLWIPFLDLSVTVTTRTAVIEITQNQ